MIPVFVAIGVWGHLLLPTPWVWLFDVAYLAVLFWRSRSAVVFVAVALGLAQIVAMTMVNHEVVKVAASFDTRQAVVTALESRTDLVKVKLLKLEGCEACSGAVGQYIGALKAGDIAKGTVLVRPGLRFGDFTLKGKLEVTAAKPSAANFVREEFLKSLRGVSSDSSALVAGLSIGDTSKFDPTFEERLKLLSLTHLNAVSGANCAIVVAAVYWGLGFMVRKRIPRTLLALVALCAYVLLVGAEASVVRAALMATIVLLAIARGVWPLAALSLTASVMLLINPHFATDYGFTLSVFATAGILVIAPLLHARFSQKLPAALSLSLAVTVAAQLWCMPFLLQLAEGLPTYAVIANLLAEPVVAPITVLGILAATLAPMAPAVSGVLTWLASVFAQWIVVVSSWLVTMPAVTATWHSGFVGMLVLVAALSAWLLRANKLATSGIVLVLCFELLANGVATVRAVSWLPREWEIVNCDVGQGDALVIRNSGKTAVVDVGRTDEPIDSCLSQLGVKVIDLLVLTHFDQDHAGGISGALAGRKVLEALVSPFADDRPTAVLARRALTDRAVVRNGHIGVSGQLGEVTWQVLNPSSSASEAEDSNDASLVMQWRSASWTLFTLADLGERGQMRVAQRFAYEFRSAGPRILKVSHHGSADQYPELIEAMRPNLALISVGKENGYGHPTKRTLELLERTGAKVLRTDLQGGLAVTGDLRFAVAGGG